MICFACGRSAGALRVWKIWHRPTDPVDGWYYALMHEACADSYRRHCPVTVAEREVVV